MAKPEKNGFIKNIKKQLTHRLRSGGREANCPSVYRGKWLSPMAALFAVLALAFLLKTVLAVVPASVSTSTYSKKNYSCTDYVSYRYFLKLP